MKMKRKMMILVAVLAATTLTVGAYYARKGEAAPNISTAQVTRGDVVATVAATGTLEAVTTVQVGSQVSGTVEALYADFNSIVHKGQVIARLDPALYQTQVEQARANVTRAQADAERLAVAVADARIKLQRAEELSERNLIAAIELEAAEVNLRSMDAQLRSAQAGTTQAQASLSQAEVNVQKTVITAPIDGIVIARNVDIGQTVAASLQAPTLFVLAADLAQMRVNASIDESAVGSVQPGQPVTFRVDAYPAERFTGTVSQVRLNPVVVQNVVTYVGMIDVSNPELKLKPGMTATVTIEIARRDNVLRAPAAALRFRPTTEVLAALGQTSPAQDDLGAAPDTSGRLWLDTDAGIKPVHVALGLSDGAQTEITGTTVEEGASAVTSVAVTAQASGTTPASVSTNPLMGIQQGPPGGFGGGRGATAAGGGAR